MVVFLGWFIDKIPLKALNHSQTWYSRNSFACAMNRVLSVQISLGKFNFLCVGSSQNAFCLLKSLGAHHFLKLKYRLSCYSLSFVTMCHSISLNTGWDNCCLICLTFWGFIFLIWRIFSPFLHTPGSLPHIHNIEALILYFLFPTTIKQRKHEPRLVLPILLSSSVLLNNI